MTQLPTSLNPVPPTAGYDPSQPYPTVRDINTTEFVGPAAENERVAQLMRRDDTLRDTINQNVALLNYFYGRGYGITGSEGSVPATADGKPIFLARDGSNQWLGPGHLNMANPTGVRHVIDGLGDASDASPNQAVNVRTALYLIGKYAPGSSGFDPTVFMPRDGSLPWIGPGHLDMGGFRGTNAADGVANNDFTTKGQVATMIASGGTSFKHGVLFDGGYAQIYQTLSPAPTVGYKNKAPCAVASIGNIANLSAFPSTYDGVTMVNGMRVLLKNQSAPAQNGLYVYNAGVLTRATDLDLWSEVPRAYTYVTGGTTNHMKGFYANVTNTSGTIGTTAMPWALQDALINRINEDDMGESAVAHRSPDYVFSDDLGGATQVVTDVAPGLWKFFYWGIACAQSGTALAIRMNVNAFRDKAAYIANGVYTSVGDEVRPFCGQFETTVPSSSTYANTFSIKIELRRPGSGTQANIWGCVARLNYLGIRISA